LSDKSIVNHVQQRVEPKLVARGRELVPSVHSAPQRFKFDIAITKQLIFQQEKELKRASFSLPR
jgi:hypothetical protein